MNGNVVDAIGGIHKTVLCSSLRMFVCSAVTVVTVQKYILKKEANARQNPMESSGSPPDKQPMQPMNAKRDWLGGQYDVRCLFLSFFRFIVLGQS